MKRRFLLGLLICVVIGSFVAVSWASTNHPIRLIVNGQEIRCDVPPQIVNGRTMVPIRALASALGCQAQWDAKTNAVTITSAGGSAPEAAAGAGAPVEYFFPRAGQHPDQELIKVINSANSSLDIAIYSLTKPDIVDAILSAEKRGVTVRIITDKEESGGKYQAKELLALSNAGVPIKINSHKGLMHLKVTIADDKVVTTGSYNYTDEATYDNDEVLVIVNDQNIAQNWDNEFQSMWTDNADYRNYTPS
jgi:phosphatidylserine/phosphatidylglycerophosphate/cardiolipin synthase-like enzyme